MNASVLLDSRKRMARGQCTDELLESHHIATMPPFLAGARSAMCSVQDLIVDGGRT